MASYSTYLYNKALGLVPSSSGANPVPVSEAERPSGLEAAATPNKQIVRFSKFTTISMGSLVNLLPPDLKQLLSEQNKLAEKSRERVTCLLLTTETSFQVWVRNKHLQV